MMDALLLGREMMSICEIRGRVQLMKYNMTQSFYADLPTAMLEGFLVVK